MLLRALTVFDVVDTGYLSHCERVDFGLVAGVEKIPNDQLVMCPQNKIHELQ